jgi:hypothetical protein
MNPSKKQTQPSNERRHQRGDHWEHTVAVEDVLARKEGGLAVLCLARENACPPEDLGGAPGYFGFLGPINNPADEEHSTMLRWIGGVI